MADLYTTLTHIKQELRNGGPIPFTPVPRSSQDVINPEYVPGMGALNECGGALGGDPTLCGECDADGGCGKLQCPVCGEWFVGLGTHISNSHDMGARVVKKKLGLTLGAPLASRSYREKQAQRSNDLVRKGVIPTKHDKKKSREAGLRGAKKSTRVRRARPVPVHTRNLHNSCSQQIINRILAIENEIGRSPSISEAKHFDPPLVQAASKYYGSWNAAKAACGLATQRQSAQYGREQLADMFAAYHAAHGTLPTRKQAGSPTVPTTPGATTVMRYFPNLTWPEAMRTIGFIAGIKGGRYLDPDWRPGSPGRQRWSVDEVRALRLCYEGDANLDRLAMRLGRTKAAISNKAYRLGISPSRTEQNSKPRSQSRVA